MPELGVQDARFNRMRTKGFCRKPKPQTQPEQPVVVPVVAASVNVAKTTVVDGQDAQDDTIETQQLGAGRETE